MPTTTDLFNRANETPLATPWVIPGVSESGFNLVSNAAAPAASTDCGVIQTGYGNDQSSKAKLFVTGGTAGDGSGIGLWVRHASAAFTGYRLALNAAATNNVELARFIGGSFTSLTQFTRAFTNGDEWELRVTGPQSASILTIFHLGTQVFQTTDNSTVASGGPGLAYSGPGTVTQIADDVTLTDVFGGTPLTKDLTPLLMTLRPMMIGVPILAYPVPIVSSVVGPDTIDLGDIASGEALSALSLLDLISLGTISSGEALSALNLKDLIALGGITSAESLFALLLLDQITLGGVASAESVPPLTLGATDTLNLTGITSGEALSNLLLTDNISLGGIASAESLSVLKLTDQISLGAIASSENVPAIFQSAMRLQGIASAETVPALTLTEPNVGSGSDGQLRTRGYGS